MCIYIFNADNAGMGVGGDPTTTVVLAGDWADATHLRYLWHSMPRTLFGCSIYSDGTAYKLPASLEAAAE